MKFLILPLMALFGCKAPQPPLETVKDVDLEKYSGRWYEMSHLPVSFQEGCDCTTAEYLITGKNYIRVINRCYDTKNNKWRSIKGKAFVVKNTGNAKLKVQFFWPFRADYWILELADDYSYAVVGSQSRKYLWILCRTKEMDPQIYSSLVQRMKEKAFPVETLVVGTHNCD
jgi:apolipoprotein D and lipocalin family protein